MLSSPTHHECDAAFVSPRLITPVPQEGIVGDSYIPRCVVRVAEDHQPSPEGVVDVIAFDTHSIWVSLEIDRAAIRTCECVSV
jgi:hypothetical protein